jgi:hypothetical protein
MVSTTVRRLQTTGIAQFRNYLTELRSGGDVAPPKFLLTDPKMSEPFEPQRSIEEHIFATRLEAADYLTDLLEGVHESVTDDIGLWSWMSLYYFDQTCPRTNGSRSPGRDYRHILEPGYRYGHRHLLAGSYLVYRMHRENARLLLCTRLDQENAFHHELASRQVFITNVSIIKAAIHLYLDPRTHAPKRGAQDTKQRPGALRRFVDVIQQLDLNYDLYSMSGDTIIDLLPPEFDEWKREGTIKVNGDVGGPLRTISHGANEVLGESQTEPDHSMSSVDHEVNQPMGTEVEKTAPITVEQQGDVRGDGSRNIETGQLPLQPPTSTGSLKSRFLELIAHRYKPSPCRSCGSLTRLLLTPKRGPTQCCTSRTCEKEEPLPRRIVSAAFSEMDVRCPRCGAKAVARAVGDGRYGSFLGCSSFPACRWVASWNIIDPMMGR